MIETDAIETTPSESRAARARAVGEQPRPVSEKVMLTLIGLVGALPFLPAVNADPDLWWHVRTGRRIIADGSIPTVDDWSFTAAGREWVNHEWLTDVLLAWAYDVGGNFGLLALRGALLVFLVACLVAVIARRVRSPIVVFVIVMATVPVLGTFINVRAHSFTYALVIWTVFVLDRVRSGRHGWLLALPLGMLAWVNLHGGFLLGLALIGGSLLAMLLGLDGVARLAPRERGLVVATGLATLAVTLLNPFGVGLYGYLASELTANHSIVSEWQPITGAQLPFFWVYLAVPVVLWLAARRWRHVTLLLILLVAALQTWQQARFFVVLGLFAAMVSAEAWAGLRSNRVLRERAPRRTRAPAAGPTLVALSVVAVVVGAGAIATLANGRGGVIVDPAIYPIRAVEWLNDRPSDGDPPTNLGLPLRWGGYALWHLPELKVAIDGRNLTVYDDDWVDAYLRAERDGRIPKLVDDVAADVWLLQAESRLVETLAATEEWHVAYADPVAVVLLPGVDGEPVAGPVAPRRTRFP